MDVGLEDVGDAQITAPPLGEVDVDVATGVDDGHQAAPSQPMKSELCDAGVLDALE